MKLAEAKSQFIQAWGTLGSKWGINRTMAQLHALLMVSPDPLSAEELMEALNISRGNANMNIRDLMDWGLVEKIHKPGDRIQCVLGDRTISGTWAGIDEHGRAMLNTFGGVVRVSAGDLILA